MALLENCDTSILVILFSILLGSRILLPLIAPPEYSSAYLVILLLLPGIAFIGIYYFAETLLNEVQKTYVIGLTMTVCAIISVILNYMLIPVMNWLWCGHYIKCFIYFGWFYTINYSPEKVSFSC